MTLGGAWPPEGPKDAWREGKTAASIRFVEEAEMYQGCSAQGLEVLRDAVERIKTGELVLSDWTTPEEYLQQNH